MTELKKKRIAVGIMQCQLAKDSGVAISNLSRYENGWANPSKVTALKLANVLGCSISDISPKFNEEKTNDSE